MKNRLLFIFFLVLSTATLSMAQLERKPKPTWPDTKNIHQDPHVPRKPCAVAVDLYGAATLATDNSNKIRLLKMARAKCPKDYSIQKALGDTYYANLDYDLAIEEFKKAIEVAGSYDDVQWVYCYRSACWRIKGNYSRALEDINNALDLEPENVRFIHDKGLIQYTMGKYDEAKIYFRRSVELCTIPSDSIVCWVDIARCAYELKQYLECITSATEAISIGNGEEYKIGETVPKTAKIGVDYSTLASAYYDRARSRITVVEENPSNNYLYLRAIFDLEIYIREKPFDEDAKKLLAEIKPKSPKVSVSKCNATNKAAAKEKLEKGIEQPDIQEAMKLYDQSIAICPTVEAYHNRSYSKSLTGLYKEGLEDANKALEFDPENNLSYFVRGIAQYKLNQFDDALLSFKHSIVVDSTYEAAKIQYQNTLESIETLKEFDKSMRDNVEKTAEATVYRLSFEAGEVHHAIMYLIEGKGYIRVRTNDMKQTVEMSIIQKLVNGKSTFVCYRPTYIDRVTVAAYDPDNFSMNIDERGFPVMENIDNKGSKSKVNYEIFVRGDGDNQKTISKWQKSLLDFSKDRIIPTK
jgi:tetratricopeptide (TPR) repeat protein